MVTHSIQEWSSRIIRVLVLLLILYLGISAVSVWVRFMGYGAPPGTVEIVGALWKMVALFALAVLVNYFN